MHFREEHFEEKFLFKKEKDDFQRTIFKHQTWATQRKTKSQNRILDNRAD